LTKNEKKPKNLNFGLLRFLGFFYKKNLGFFYKKNLGFFEAIFQPWCQPYKSTTHDKPLGDKPLASNVLLPLPVIGCC